MYLASAFSPSFHSVFFSCSEFSETNFLGFEFCNVQTQEQNQQSAASFSCSHQKALCFKCVQYFYKMWLKVILSNLAFIIVLRKL